MKTTGRVRAARCIALERQTANSGVVGAVKIVCERAFTDGRIVVAIVAKERLITDGGVEIANVVQLQRAGAKGAVSAAAGVDSESISAVGRIARTYSVVRKRPETGGCISAAASVAKSALTPVAVLWSPSVLLKSA